MIDLSEYFGQREAPGCRLTSYCFNYRPIYYTLKCYFRYDI